MNKVILHSNLLCFYGVAELEEIVEHAMIEKLDEGNYEEFLVEANRHGGRRVKARLQ